MAIPDYTFEPPSKEMVRFTQLLNEFSKAVVNEVRRIGGASSRITRVVSGGLSVAPKPGEVVVWVNGTASATALGAPSAAPGAVVYAVPVSGAASLYVSDGASWKAFTGA